jgi:Lysozyme like domain
MVCQTSQGRDPNCHLPKFTSVEVYKFAYNAGFRGAALDEIVAISAAESGWDPCAFNKNINCGGGPNGNVIPLSTDWGILQINDSWNPGQFPGGSHTAVQDPTTAFKWAFNMVGNNTSAMPSFWCTARNGGCNGDGKPAAYLAHLTHGPQGGSIVGTIGSVNGTTGTPNTSNPGAGATQTVSGTPGSSFPGTSDPCLGCGAVGSAAYASCHAALAAKVGTPPACAQAGIIANQTQIAQQTGIDLPAISAQIAQIGQGLTNIVGFMSNLSSIGTWFQQSGPSALIKIGLFLVAVVLVGMGFFLVANAEELG